MLQDMKAKDAKRVEDPGNSQQLKGSWEDTLGKAIP